MKESDLEHFMVQPWVVTCSDGSDGHPRKYGTFPRKLRELVFDKPLLTLPQAVRSSSGATAAILDFTDRGVLATGKVSAGIYVVLKGAIRVTGNDGHGHELPVTEHGPGHFSGELSQLSRRPSFGSRCSGR